MIGPGAMGGGKQRDGAVEDAPSSAAAMAKMVAGVCAHPDCIVLANAMEAISNGMEVAGPSDEPAVCVTCTFTKCTAGGTMHAECFAKLESLVTKHVAGQANKMWKELKPSERAKALWTTKYDLVLSLIHI